MTDEHKQNDDDLPDQPVFLSLDQIQGHMKGANPAFVRIKPKPENGAGDDAPDVKED
jgi:hypothetical protein